jgi:prepilin-type N-terminal cleavage/methylation domain-containing protein
MRSGFTLLELVVVVIIIGILASVAVPQYMVTVERSRLAEGLGILGSLREAQLRYYAENGVYANDIDNIDVVIDTSSVKYFENIEVDDRINTVAAMSRNNTASGYCGNYDLEIAADGTITCSNSACCTKFGF